MRFILLALGANRPGLWGAPQVTLPRAIEALKLVGIQIVEKSRIYQTAPVGGPGRAPYANAVVLAKSSLPPTKVLALLKQVERAAGRRTHGRWAPRPLDIDILDDRGKTLGWRRRRDATVRTIAAKRGPARPALTVTQLVLPHPRMHLRAFVLVPLLDVAPYWRHPVLGLSGRALLQALGVQRRGIRLAGQQWPST